MLPYTEQLLINWEQYTQRMMTTDLTKYYYSDEKTFLLLTRGAHYYCKPEHRSIHPNNWIVDNTSCQIKCWEMISYNYKSPLVIFDERLA